MKARLLKGYEAVTLSKKGTRDYGATIHREVARAFCGGEGDQVRHLDGNKRNNHYTNLVWGTSQENADDRERHGTLVRGEKHARARFDEILVLLIRDLHADGLGQSAIGRWVGENKSRIHEIIHRITWKHI